MNIRQWFFAASIIVAATSFSACGSSSNAPAPVPPFAAAPAIPAVAAYSASSSYTPTAAAQAVALPANAVVSGAIDFGAATSLPPGTTVSDSISNAAPSLADAPALSDVLRKALDRRSAASANGGIVVLAYLNLLYSKPVTYLQRPSFRLTVPAAEILPSAHYYVAAFDPTVPTLGWQLGFEGPATVSGSTLKFSGASVPFSFAANANYYFAVFAISAAAVAPTPAPSVAPIVPTAAPSAIPSTSPSTTPSTSPSTTPSTSPSTSPTTSPLAAFTATLTSGGTLTFRPNIDVVTSLVLPTASSTTTAIVTPSTLPPSGISAAPGNVLIYATVTPAANITFTGGTVSGSFVSPSGTLTGSFYFDLLVPGNLGLGWLSSSPTAGTASLVNFSYALTQPITLYANSTYVFAVSTTAANGSK